MLLNAWRRVLPGLLAMVVVASILPLTTPPASAQGQRYIDDIFGVDSIYDVVYGQAVNNQGDLQDLTMNIFSPSGDSLAYRPVVVWIHGGSFIGGDKSSMTDEAKDLARKGYVSVAINYRLAVGASWDGTSIGDVLNDPEVIKAIGNALTDSQTAVAFLRENAEVYGIDTDKIAAGGYSAGAVTALNLAYLPNRNLDKGTWDDPRHIRATISLAGTTLPGFAQTGEPAAYMVHGTGDTVVNYSEGVTMCQAIQAANNRCDLLSLPTTHLLSPFEDQFRPLYTQFLYEEMIAPAPYIEDTSPAAGGTNGGETVTLTGKGFTGVDTISVGGVPATNIAVVNDHTLTFTAPAQPAGLTNISAYNANGTNPLFPSGTWFNVTSSPPPVIDGTDPGTGTIFGGTSVTITGSGFTGATGVDFAGAATPFTVVDDTTLTTTSPPGEVGGVDVTVTTPTGSDTLAGGFVHALPPPTFVDVAATDTFFIPIEWGAWTDLATGWPDQTFRPTNPTSRQAAIAWLWRLADSPTGPFPAPAYTDIAPSHPFYTAIAWATAEGLATGWPDLTFRPTNPTSRQAAMAWLSAYAG